jgi:predicted kinase
MPPEFAQQMQQLFARQMAVAFLHHCAQLDAPVSLVNPRLEALQAGADDASAAAAQALEAEFLLDR